MNAPIDQRQLRGHRKAMLAEIPLAPSLERRRLRSYLAMMVGDIVALFAGFAVAGELYLGHFALARSLVFAQLLLPVYLTIALYNATYSIAALRSPMLSMARSLAALLISSATVVFISFYTKSTQDFSRVTFTLGVVLTGSMLIWR